MKRATLLTLTMALILALVAGVAVAKTINGTNGNDNLFGTVNNDYITGKAGNDTIKAFRGNDFVYGNEGSDTLRGNEGSDKVYGGAGADDIDGGFGDDPALSGEAGNDKIRGGLGSDRILGATGDDTIRAEGDTKQDFVNCGEDASGTDVDTAHVNGQDTVDSQQASLITSTTGLSCEMLFVDGVRIPTVPAP